MRWIVEVRERVTALLSRTRRDVEMDDELRFHLERETDRLTREAGLGAQAAKRQASTSFGGLEKHKEEIREARGLGWLEHVAKDVRFAVRVLARDRWFTLVTVTTLALCLGGNVAVFSAVYSVVMKPLAVPEPERIMFMVDAYPNAFPGGGEGRVGTSPAHYFDRLAEVNVFEEQALVQPRAFAVGEQGRPEQYAGLAVTPSFFRLFRVRPLLGRGFLEEETDFEPEQTVVLSHGLWQQLFNSDGDVVGRDLRIDGRPHEVVGVMPADFDYVGIDVRLWVPLALTDEERSARHGGRPSLMFGRLKTGATAEHAREQIEALNTRNLERFPYTKTFATNAGFHTIVVPLQHDMVRGVRNVLYLLWGGVGLVLLIGCVNVANLMIFRSSARMREFGTRVALGASRWRLARQVLVETVLLTLAGAAGGLLLGGWCLDLLAGPLGIEHLPRGGEIGIDTTIIGLTLGIALVLGGVLGLAPVVSVPTTRLQALLHREGRSGTMGKTRRLVQRGLVVAQISLAFVLLTGAVLLLTSFQRLLSADPGFSTARLVTATVDLSPVRYEDADGRRQFPERAIERLRRVPGIRTVGLTDGLPFGTCCGTIVVSPEGSVPSGGAGAIAPNRVVVDEGYLETMGIPLLEGRFFTGRDTVDSPSVVMVDPVLARRFWPDESPLGKRMYYGVDATDTTDFFTVVGTVGTHAMRGPDDPRDAGAYFVPLRQSRLPLTRLTFVIRTAGDPTGVLNAVRSEIAALDPDLPLFDVQTMEERIQSRLTPRLTPMLLSLGFALLALFLAALGIHGVLAYRVAQRVREFGIRLALGTSPAKLFRLIIFEGLVLLALGLGLGMAGSVALSDVIGSQLFQTQPLDPGLLAATVAILAAIALLASAVSARQAAHTIPVTVLNHE